MAALLQQHDFTAEVESLRRYIHEALGWSYHGRHQRPVILSAMIGDGIIYSKTGAFTFEGCVWGRGYGKQSFELNDVTAVPVPQPKPDKFKHDPFDHEVWGLSSFGKGETRISDGFQGVILSLEHHKTFLGKTIIRRDRGALNPLKINGLKRVGFASSEFERLFEVYSNDQVEARTLLSPDFMARLIDFDEDYLGRHIQCVFDADRFHVCLDIDDRFEFSGDFNSRAYDDASTRILSEIGAIFYLLEKVQALQACIGRDGPEGADEKRGAYYRGLMETLRGSISAGQEAFPSMRKDRVTHYESPNSWQHLLLSPRF
jgi:hypothetical protein